MGELEFSIQAVSRAKESHRKDHTWFTHLTLIAEGAPAIGWVVTVGLVLVVPSDLPSLTECIAA